MKKKRIFIAVNLPAGVRSALEKESAALFAQFPETVRFTAPELWHFTITFLGDQTDENIGAAVEALTAIAPQFQPPEITINKILYGPVGKTPRMIWAITDDSTSAALGEIKSALEDELANRGVNFEREYRKYQGHITLARFDIALRDFPQIEKPLTLSFVPESMDLMESTLTHAGPEYALLTAVDFAEDII